MRNPKNRKNEIQASLRRTFSDSSISFIHQAFGLMGLIKFTQGYYAVVIDKMDMVGRVSDHEIYSVKRSSLLPLFEAKACNLEKSTYKSLSSYLNLEKCDFFFSYSYDLSHNLQDNFIYSFKEKQPQKYFFEQGSLPNFQWNLHCSRNFESKCRGTSSARWVVRAIHGSFEQIRLELFSNIISVSLIGRRLIQNAGTRYNRRGLNSEVTFFI